MRNNERQIRKEERERERDISERYTSAMIILTADRRHIPWLYYQRCDVGARV